MPPAKRFAAGPVLDARTADGHTPEQLATTAGHAVFLEQLREWRRDVAQQLGGGRGSYGSPSRRVSDAFNRTFRRGSNAAQTQSGQLLSGSLPRRARGADSLMISSEI